MSDPIKQAVLSAQALTLGYQTGHPVVRAVSLRLPPGRFTAIVGPNGCGKSTLLAGLGGLLKPFSGEVLLAGRNLARMGQKSIARHITTLAQGAQAPQGISVFDLVRQGRYPHRGLFDPWGARDQARVEAALARVGLTHLRNHPLSALSGGQRQRAWIAQTLAQEGQVMLLDEPTTYLDLAHQIEVLRLLRGLVDDAGISAVAVLHDLNQAARYADHVVMMRDGRILAEGAPGDVLQPDRIAAVFDVEVSVLRDPETGGALIVPRT